MGYRVVSLAVGRPSWIGQPGASSCKLLIGDMLPASTACCQPITRLLHRSWARVFADFVARLLQPLLAISPTSRAQAR